MDEVGLTSIAEAFAATKAEQAPAEAGGAEPTPVVAGEPQATPGAEQPTEPTLDGQKQELIAELLEPPTDESGTATPPEPGSKEFWGQTVEVQTVDGTQQIPLGQLRDGFMRQADYTRKTQEVAALRQQLGEAAGFLEQYRSDPQAFARALAVEQGLIYPGDQPVSEVPGARFPTAEEIDQRVEQLVAERVQSDPAVQEAATVRAHAVVNNEFDRLEGVHQVKIPPELRESLTQEAIERGIPDFDLLLRARLASVQDRRRQTGQLQGAAPSRPGMAPAAQQQRGEPPAPITTIEQAWREAALEQSQLT